MDDLSTALRAVIRDEVARQLAEIGRPGPAPAASAPAPPILLTLAEAADYIGVKAKTLYEWRRLRKGPQATPVGRLVKYRASDLDVWLAESRS